MEKASRPVNPMHGETIYQLVPPQEIEVPKAPLYHSKHDGRINPQDYEMGVKQPKKSATMGWASGTFKSYPAAFQSRHTIKITHSKGPSVKKLKLIRKEPVPSRAERPVMGLRTDKDFVRINAIETIEASPPPQPGDETFWFTSKPDFGKVPAYLERTKKELAKEKADMDAYLATQGNQERKARELPREEREHLVRLLKSKWEQMNSDFLRLPFALDTPAKQKRKELYESQLKQIEEDIRLLERSDTLMLEDD